MGFDFAREGPKFLQLLYGLIAFVIVVGGLLLLLDVGPRLAERSRTRRAARRAARPTPVGRRPGGLNRLRRRRRATRPPERWQVLGFLLPSLLLVMVGLVVPAFRTTILSFMDAQAQKWVGWANYEWMFTLPENILVLRNTLIWVVLVPLLATSIGLLYAVVVDRARYESFAKSLIFMPTAISFVGAGIIWNFIYAYRFEGAEQIGVLNQLWVMFGGAPQQWLLKEEYAVNTLLLLVVMVWIQAGFAMVVLSAAIKAIPADIVEAARLDGVNAWQMFWQVTLPSIRPAVVVVVMTISIATLKVFDIVRTMTGGRFETSVIANEMYFQAFPAGERGRGAALAVFLFLLVIPIVIYQVRVLRQRREAV